MLTTYLQRNYGFSLIELMISMALGMGLLTALVSFVSINLSSNAKLLMRQRLQQELHSITNLISDDIRRAGFNRNSTTLLIAGNLALSPFPHQFSISSYPREMANSCILYAYDKDQDGQFDTEKSHEGFGFRLHKKAIEMRQGGSACDAGGWQDISDSGAILINHFKFHLHENNHQLTLRIDAAVKRHPTMTYTIQRSWTLANAI